MSDPKPFASLSSGLLARTGAARPAMRPQGFSSPNSGLDDLGWNDMGQEAGHDHAGLTPLTPVGQRLADEQVVDHPRAPHSLGLSPVTSPVHSQQAELAERLAEGDEEYDEEFDETAEPYEPEAGSGKFNGFDLSDGDEEPEPEFRVQFKGGKKPLDLGPPLEPAEQAVAFVQPEPEPQSEPEDEVLDLVEEVAAVAVAVVPALPDEPVLRSVRAPAAKAKAAFTLRLDPQRHLKLRLACAVRGGSAQQLVTDALDRLLQSMPELEELTDKVRQRN